MSNQTLFKFTKPDYLLNIFFKLLFTLFVSCGSNNETHKITVGFFQDNNTLNNNQNLVSELEAQLFLHSEIEFININVESNSNTQNSQKPIELDSNIDILIVSINEDSTSLQSLIKQANLKEIPIIVVGEGRNIDTHFITSQIDTNHRNLEKTIIQWVMENTNDRATLTEVFKNEGSNNTLFFKSITNSEKIEHLGGIQWDDISTIDSSDDNFIFIRDCEYLEDLKSEKVKAILFSTNSSCLKLIENNTLNAVFIQQTGANEVVHVIQKIIENKPIVKKIVLTPLKVDKGNLDLYVKQQQLYSQLVQKQFVSNVKLQIAKNRSMIAYVFLVALIILIILGAIVLISLKDEQRTNQLLEVKNAEISNQRNKVEILAKKLEATTNEKIRFFTNISHEFRTPLTLVLGPVDEWLAKKIGVTKHLRNDLEQIKNNALRLMRLINQLMDFRKIEKNKIKLQAKKGDVVSFVFKIKEAFNYLASQRKIDFEFISEVDTLQLWFDVDKLDKVLFNLLSNAFKFTNDSGKIYVKIEVKELDNTVEISVVDNGIGLSPEQIDKAFDRYYQGEDYSSKGTGLGLSLSKEFIKMHRGHISLESEKWNKTSFKIILPLGDNHLLEEEKLNPQETPNFWENDASPNFIQKDIILPSESENKIEKTKTILVIEDNGELRQYLISRLSKFYFTEEAANGNIGINKAYETIPDLILCDLMLPGKGGYEIISQLKSDKRTSHIPIIFLTAMDGVDNELKGYQLGADDYVTKPFYLNILLEKIKNKLALRQVLKERYINCLLYTSPSPRDA